MSCPEKIKSTIGICKTQTLHSKILKTKKEEIHQNRQIKFIWVREGIKKLVSFQEYILNRWTPPHPSVHLGIQTSNDAKFHHTFQCLSLNVKDQYWERDLVEHEVWLPNWRRHQVKAGAVRVLERGSRLRIPRRRASPMLKSSWASASTQGWLVDIFCAWLKWD